MKNPFDTPECVAFRKTLRDFVEKEIKPHADAWDEAGEIPWDLHQRAGALGVWGFGIEEQYGGLGMDDCFMRAAYGVPAALNGRMISIEPIQRLANANIRSRALPEILSGRKGSSLGITEPSGSSEEIMRDLTVRQMGL
jgi:acyl-CoA dehydrogenase